MDYKGQSRVQLIELLNQYLPEFSYLVSGYENNLSASELEKTAHAEALIHELEPSIFSKIGREESEFLKETLIEILRVHMYLDTLDNVLWEILLSIDKNKRYPKSSPEKMIEGLTVLFAFIKDELYSANDYMLVSRVNISRRLAKLVLDKAKK